MNKIESINLIYRNPKIRGGKPCIVGTSLRVLDIVSAMRWNGRSPEQMADAYQVSLAQVHAALAFYYENQDEIDADIREDQRRSEEIAEEVLANKRSLYSRLQRYMRDDDFRVALDEALEAPNESRTARIRALFDKMHAEELEGEGFTAEQLEETSG
ncbi:MAG: DUF433 domain-containing protein [Chloroflexota bacterium]|nr:DUF433 domain-containing protein [Chloroflexota bacterium]MDE2908832.1 DUF433 domain-containing protein [Chloroflexota bacterium]